MPGKHFVSKLPEPDLSQSLNSFLSVINQHPHLAHFRSLVPAGPTRQLALFAALERDVLVGSASAAPPAHDDEADQLLCDILDVIDTHPDLKNRSAYYGPDCHLVNLQALGVWNGGEPIQKPSAHELFTTQFSALNTEAQTLSPSSDTNYSPGSQVLAPNGELIDSPSAADNISSDLSAASETIDTVVVLTVNPNAEGVSNQPNHRGIIHHPDQTSGEKVGWAVPATPPPVGWDQRAQLAPAHHNDGAALPASIPSRPIRRGRPPKLDDFAKGRLLGLMSHGLSFRQAAAQLGVHHVTLLNALKRDEQFAQQVSEARFDAISQPLFTVIHASRTNWRAAAWLAKFLNDRRTSIFETTPEERLANGEREASASR